MAAALAIALVALSAEEIKSDPAKEAPTVTPFNTKEPSLSAALAVSATADVNPPKELTALKLPIPKSLV